MKNCTINKNIHLLENKIFEGERPLFKSHHIDLKNCQFVQGESGLKFVNYINAIQCEFSSKYLFWHDTRVHIFKSIFNDGARASIWYSDSILLENCEVNSAKIFRDAKNITIKNSTLNTNETLWDCNNIIIDKVDFQGDYLLFHSNNIEMNDFHLEGNYSFQHTQNIVAKNIKIKSKDAFWNSENVTIYDSIIEGEYLGWYSKNLKFVNCTIIGTQPLCYAKNLVLENCEMIDTDLAFEDSTINATITSSIMSVKNPLSGYLKAKEIKELILDEQNDLLQIEIENKID
ncbi:DUF3737 family protein [Arcobacter caeni]|uniref:Hydrogenase n=1 Tax=Arcobacter caeni TaxID=1912877 RepID=A0A363D195_9BACT|nr:DUF3737 family protein [Arcobacter caeni]PUE65105.1 hypothetical protein B0174_04715 [Arcobacter caeni]